MITSTGVKGFISPQLFRTGDAKSETHYAKRNALCKVSLMNRSSLISPRIQHKVALLQVLTVFAVGSWLLNFLQWSFSVGTDCNF